MISYLIELNWLKSAELEVVAVCCIVMGDIGKFEAIRRISIRYWRFFNDTDTFRYDISIGVFLNISTIFLGILQIFNIYKAQLHIIHGLTFDID